MRIELWYGGYKKEEYPIKFRWEVEVWKKIFGMRARLDGWTNYWVYLIHEPNPSDRNLPDDQSRKFFYAIFKHQIKEEEENDRDTKSA